MTNVSETKIEVPANKPFRAHVSYMGADEVIIRARDEEDADTILRQADESGVWEVDTSAPGDTHTESLEEVSEVDYREWRGDVLRRGADGKVERIPSE